MEHIAASKISKKHQKKNIKLMTTEITGYKPKSIFADFKMAEEGKKVITCADGNKPKSCSYIKQS